MSRLCPPATVGILTRRAPSDSERKFGPPTAFFEECCAAGQAAGMQVTLFEAADVHPETQRLTPAAFRDGQWQECGAIPWPDVVYDRAPFVDPVYAPPANQVRLWFVQAGIPFINPVDMLRLAANKWMSYQHLSRYSLSLPETAPLTPGHLNDFLNRHHHLYIKPVEGSQGVGILEVARSASNTWSIQTGIDRYEAHSNDEVERIIATLAGNLAFQSGVYLVQRGVSPEPAQARKLPRFDLRSLMQKDERGAWLLTGIVARVNRKDVPTSNLSTGAWSEEAESTLDMFFGLSRRQAIMDMTERASFAICEALNRDVCPFGELGIDFIPDEHGQPWVIEINARPGRSGFKRLARSNEVTEQIRQRFQQIRARSVERPFLYAKTLRHEETLSAIQLNHSTGVEGLKE